MNIQLHGNIPIIHRWIVKYDDVYQMPQFVQGKIVGNTSEHNSGDTIIIRDIESIDLKNKYLKTYDGSKYMLVGSGKRMILIDEQEMLEIALKEMGEINE